MFRWLGLFLVGISLSGCLVPLSHKAEYDAREVKSGAVTKSFRGGYKLYKVQVNDSLFDIALRFDVTYQQLAAWNHLRYPYRIYPGDQLKIKRQYKNYRDPVSNQRLQVEKTPPVTVGKKTVQVQQKTHQIGVSKVSNKPLSIQWSWPALGQILLFFKTGVQPNKGIDISGSEGDPVFAAADGQVVYTGNSLRGYGNLIIVKHAHDFLSAYGHNSKILVKEGEYVKAGKKIAEIGSTGADISKLHFEIRQAGTPVNPLHYLPEKLPN